MSANYRVYAHILHQSHSVLANACAFLAHTGAHQVEFYKVKDGLYRAMRHEFATQKWWRRYAFTKFVSLNLPYLKKTTRY